LFSIERVPCNVLCRLDEPGVKDLALAQWRSAPAHSHHEVSREFFGEGSALLPLVEAIDEEGNMHATLAAECDSIADIPFDGTAAEEPHARACRVGEASRASSWPWIASTMRLTQNLADCHDLPERCGVSLQRLWNNWKSVTQTNPKFCRRNRRVVDVVFTTGLYSIASGRLDATSTKDS
jgi:hypothetical protein